jgi:vitamin B12 transporter
MSSALLLLVAVAQQPQDTVVLKPVVVTATRVAAPAAAVPVTVTVLTGKSLQERGLRTVADALRESGGVTVVETGGPGSQTSLFLRGGESDYVKVLLDGVPLNLPGGAIDLADLTLDNVDRIEIVRGPASVLYGSDAVTGVVEIFTRGGGGGAQRISAGARAGTRNATEFTGDASGGGPRAGYAVSVSRFGSEGLYPYNSEYRNTSVSARLRVAPDLRTSASLAYGYGDNVYHFPTDGAGAPSDSNQVSTERGPTVSASLTRFLGDHLDLRATTTLRELRQLTLNEPDSPGEDGRFESSDLIQRLGAGVMANWRPGETGNWIVTAGVDYERARQRGRSLFEASFGTFPDSINVRRENRAAFLQVLAGLQRRVSVTVGVRGERNSQFGDHATYRAGVVYRPREATRFRASAGTGFKEPTFFENYARGFVSGNPALDPERTFSWEAGIDQSFGRVNVAATYFDQRFRDLIEFTFTPTPPDTVNYFNVAGATARGLELSLDAPLARAVTAGARYTYLRTRVLEPGLDPGPDAAFAPGTRLLRRPAHAFSLNLRAAVRRAVVSVDATHARERDDLDFSRPAGSRRVTLDALTRLHVGVEVALLPEVTLLGRIENVLDDRVPEIAGFRPRGRTIMLGGRVGRGL